MAERLRSEVQREKDLEETGRLYCQGWTQARIAEHLKVGRTQIAYDLKDLRKRWLSASIASIDQHKAEQLAKIDRLEAVAWDAWERSCLDAESRHTRTEKVKQGNRTVPAKVVEEKTAKGQSGDPRFLERVGWCIDRRCKILGLDAAEKHEFTGDLTTDQRRTRLAAVFAALRQRAGADGAGDAGPGDGGSLN